MGNKTIIIVLAGIILLASVFYLFTQRREFPSPTEPLVQKDTTGDGTSFATPKKSAHYESNTPAHGSVLAGVPLNVVIDFNFDLALQSEIKILGDGKDYGTGQTSIDTNKLAMRKSMDANTPDGTYRVEYNACWPDKSCHDGYFEFAIDRTKKEEFTDMRGEKEQTVTLQNIAFEPASILIDKGTKVMWVNKDTVSHYVNTDSHPTHTYFTNQNSRELTKGDTYSVVFETPGIYPYHCSAHAETMTGSILVE